MNIETMYANEEFDEYLVFLANGSYLPFDDFKQDVFLNILEHGPIFHLKDAKRIARRIRDRTKAMQIKESELFCHGYII